MSSVFDLSGSGKKPGKKPEKSPLAKKSSSTPPPKITDAETRNMLERIKLLQSKLNEQIEDVMKKTGKDPTSVMKFAQNPSNFSPEQWNKMIEKKEELEKQITGLTKEQIQTKHAKKDLKESVKGRKGKTLGSRKKWLDMR